MLRGIICSFKGNLNIERVEFIRNINKELYLVAVGSYQFKENCEKGGIFEGAFRTYYFYDMDTKKLIKDDNTDEYNYSRGFAGLWISPDNKTTYTCYFGFIRYPQSLAPGFGNHGGEALMNPKYKKYGWESHFVYDENPYIVPYTSKECDNQ